MAFHTQIAEPKKAYGLSPGDIVRTPANDTLLRYVGVRKGLPNRFAENLFPGQEFLVFEIGIPFYGDGPSPDYRYLATQGEPVLLPGEPVVPLEEHEFLDYRVDELEKIGNIDDKLWKYLSVFSKWHLDAIQIDHGDSTTTLGRLLETYATRQTTANSK